MKLKKSLEGRKLSESHCLNISKGSKNRIVSKETCHKISKKLTGRKLSDKHKEKSTNIILKNRFDQSIKIDQFNKNNKYIKTWNSAIIAAKELKICRSNIVACLKKRRKSVGGFIFKLAENKSLEFKENPVVDNIEPSVNLND